MTKATPLNFALECATKGSFEHWRVSFRRESGRVGDGTTVDQPKPHVLRECTPEEEIFNGWYIPLDTFDSNEVFTVTLDVVNLTGKYKATRAYRVGPDRKLHAVTLTQRTP